MLAENKTALVIGATGLIGDLVIEELLNSNRYAQIQALVRKPLLRQHPKLTSVVFDFGSPHSLHIKVDDVYCCLGTTMKKAGSKAAFFMVDYTYPYEIAKVAQANGAKRFAIVTAMGADKNSLVYYNRVKGEIENALKKLNFEALLIFRPSLLLGNRSEKRRGEQMGESFMKLFKPLIPEKYRAIEASKVAKAMVLITCSNVKGNIVYESDVLQEF